MAGGGSDDRIIALVDMDCFYVQVEERDDPTLKGHPAAVVQYNSHRGGGLIAVNYEARALGVKRNIRGSDATEVCPGIRLVTVPILRGKANLQKYRCAGKEVLSVLCGYSELVERASIDEAYLDLTQVVERKISSALAGRTRNTDGGTTMTDPPVSEGSGSKGATCGASLGAEDTTVGSVTERLLSLVASVEQLPSTWVSLPDDVTSSKTGNEVTYDLGDKESRKKYELNETVASQWKPGANDGNTGAEQIKASNVDDTGAAPDPAALVGEEIKTEKTSDEAAQVARVADLTKWLADLRRAIERETRESNGLDNDEEEEPDSGMHETGHMTKSKTRAHFSSTQPPLNSTQTPLNSTVRAPNSIVGNNTSSSCTGVSGATLSTLRLAVAAELCEEIRAAVLKETGFKCSAGVGHNKVLAKLVCGLHKPNQQTVIPSGGVEALWRVTPVHKVRNLGGKLGESLVADFGVKTMADLSAVSLSVLRGRYDDKTAMWLHGLAQGRDSEAVVSRQLPQSVGCSKNFLGPETLRSRSRVEEWTRALSEELAERLIEDQMANKRVSRTLTVGWRTGGSGRGRDAGASQGTRAVPVPSYAADRIAAAALAVLTQGNTTKQGDVWSPAIHHISLSAGKFEDCFSSAMPSISDLFKRVAQKKADEAKSDVISRKPLTEAINGEDTIVEQNAMASSHHGDHVGTSNATSKRKGIMAYFTDGLITADTSKEPGGVRQTSLDLNSNDSNSVSTTASVDTVQNLHNGTSFFKRFLLKKLESESGSETSSVDTNDGMQALATANKDNNFSLHKAEDCDDSGEEALNMLIDELTSNDESSDEENDVKAKLCSKPIIESKNTTPQSDYDASTDDDDHVNDVKVERLKDVNINVTVTNTKSDMDSIAPQKSVRLATIAQRMCKNSSTKILESSTASPVPTAKTENSSNKAITCHDSHHTHTTSAPISRSDAKRRSRLDDPDAITVVSVTELFPDLSAADESLLPLLPPGLRAAATAALARYKAETAGRNAIEKTGMWKYLNVGSKKRKEEVTDVGRDHCRNGSERVPGVSGIRRYMKKKPLENECDDSEMINVASTSTSTPIKAEASASGFTIDISKCITTGVTASSHYKVEPPTAAHKIPSSNSKSEDKIVCDRCTRTIKLIDIDEHADYHVALDLQNDSSSGGTSQNRAGSSEVVGSSKGPAGKTSCRKNTKRKLCNNKTPEIKKSKTIDTFFNK